MLDIKFIEKNYKLVKRNLIQRGYVLQPNTLRYYWKIKEINQQIENINKLLNAGLGNLNAKQQLAQLKLEKTNIEKQYFEIIHMIPNLLEKNVPKGENANDNVEIKRNGNLLETNIGYMTIAKNNGLNIDIGVNLAGARFNTMNGKIAKTHRKLINLAIDFYETLGYDYHYLPNLVNEKTMFGTGQFPKFKDDLFKTENGLYLIPTGEVPLTNIVNNQILKKENVYKKILTHTPCFRKEVGAAGKDTTGIIRQHQFEKVELVQMCLPENGLTCFHELVNNIEQFVMKLGITYRIIELCTKDIGFAGHKAYDFEVWFPYEKRWREIATVTWCGDFQGRRMNVRYTKDNGKKEFIHTLNGTGLAVGRVMACLIETHGEKTFDFVNDL